MEVNAHSLFSKWFSESGKLVSRLFSKIMELVGLSASHSSELQCYLAACIKQSV